MMQAKIGAKAVNKRDIEHMEDIVKYISAIADASHPASGARLKTR
jgi:hypothetical protein